MNVIAIIFNSFWAAAAIVVGVFGIFLANKY